MRVIQTAADTWTVYFAIHHIISDGWSMGVLIRDVLLYYNHLACAAPVTPQPLRIQYKDYAVWQSRWLTSGAAQRSRQYWLRKLTGNLAALDLQTRRPRPPLKSYRGAVRRREIDPAVVRAVTELARRHDATLFMVLLSAIKLLIFKYTNEEDVIVGIPAAGRDHPDLSDQIGFFVNTLAIRDRVDPCGSFIDLLQSVRTSVLEGYEHQDYPFESVWEELCIFADPSRNPVFDIAVVMNETFMLPEMAGLRVESIALESKTAKFDLTFIFSHPADTLSLDIEYNTDLFDVDAVVQLGSHLTNLLASVGRDSSRRNGSFSLIDSEEEDRLLTEFARSDLESSNISLDNEPAARV
jgi:hypothetical protein